MKKFIENDNIAVFTTRFILNERKPILFIYHYLEDGAWQFSGEDECEESDYRIVSLDEMIQLDKTILEMANLELGYFAYRNGQESEWLTEKL